MKNLFFSLFFFITTTVFAQEHYMIVGTYDSPKSEGIYVFKFNSDNGTAKEISYIKTPNPSFLALSADEKFVYTVHETAPQGGKGGDVAAFTFDKKNGTLSFVNKQLSGGDHPCHVEVDKSGSWLFVSNYTGGSLSTLPINSDGSLGNASVIQHTGSSINLQRQKSPHVHGAIISNDNKKLFVTDLGIDKLMIYDFEASSGKLSLSKQKFVQSVPGSGPRLFTFHPNNKFSYMIEELSGTIVVFKNKKNNLITLQRISTLPVGDTSFAGSADIHVSPDGNFLYASNRGEINTIAIYKVNKMNGKLRLIGHQSTMGKTPRNFSLDPSGNYLLVENQNSDEIVVFKRNLTSGLLTDTGNRISIGKPVCIKWLSIQ